jgi:FKBP-type peptidyl-prolyl cis-trans isomerase
VNDAWLALALVFVSACGAEPAVPTVRPEAPPTVAGVEEPPSSPDSEPPPAAAPTAEEPEPELRLTKSGLGIVELRVGNGPEAQPGRQIVVHYVGHLTDGREFDSSRTRGTPFEFELGAGTVIAGWDEGIEGMRAGGVRKLIIPSAMAYGAQGRPPSIPPNAVLEFEVELLEVR